MLPALGRAKAETCSLPEPEVNHHTEAGHGGTAIFYSGHGGLPRRFWPRGRRRRPTPSRSADFRHPSDFRRRRGLRRRRQARGRAINANGGVNGKLELAPTITPQDPEAVSLYKTYKDQEIFLIQGWGTGNTNALKDMVNADKIVYMSASYDSLINDPAKNPYNFYVGPLRRRDPRLMRPDTWTDATRKPRWSSSADRPCGKGPIPRQAMAESLG
jgi:hypothetical protein